MHPCVRSIIVAALPLLAWSAPAVAQTSPAGQWDGVVSVSNNTVEIPFKFEITEANGSYRGYFFDGDVKVPSQPGTVTLMSRATDSRGRTQAMTREPDRENYLISHVLPIDVNIR